MKHNHYLSPQLYSVHVTPQLVTMATSLWLHWVYFCTCILVGYWSSFSFCVMLVTRSFRKRRPRTQRWASSAVGHFRSRLFLDPVKITVKHWSSGTVSDSRLRASDWQPSRTQSTSVTATGGEAEAEFLACFHA